MKTKPFLLATAGSTVDGRVIDEKMLQEMADSYNPATYSAPINIEHITGVTGEKPFRIYGDVLELSTNQVEVDFNGQKEKRLGLFGVLDINDDAKALNDAGQKRHPSIEIETNFAGKGFAYCMGVAMTDRPASVATEKMKFNRSLPGVITLTAAASGVPAAALEPAEEVAAQEAAIGVVAGFFTKLSERMGFNAPAEPIVVTPPAPKVEDKPAFDPAAFAKELGETLTGALGAMTTAFNSKVDNLSGELTALKQQLDNTPAPGHQPRPRANGNANYARTDC